MSSLSKATVFRVSGLTKHPNADLLSVGEFEGCPFIVNMNDTKEGDLRIFLPFDMCVPDRLDMPEFVRGKRVKPVRLRGIFSMAVCLPLPEGEFVEGEDVTERLGFTKWLPPHEREEPDGVIMQNSKSGYRCKGPDIILPKYDLESLRKYHDHLVIGERVIIMEKIEGENIAIVYYDGKLHVKSRNLWKEEGDNKWWNAVRKYDWTWLEQNEGLVVFGEKYGNVNKFRYDCISGEERIRIFDLYDTNTQQFLSWRDVVCKTVFAKNPLLFAPILYDGRWKGLDEHKHLAEGKSTFGENLREGFVVRPFVERQYGSHFDRLCLKYHGEKYLEFKGKHM